MSFGAHCTNLNEDRPILSATKMQANDSSFRKYKVHADIRGGSSWRGRQMRVGLSTTAIFNLAIWMAASSETSRLRPAILYDDMLPLVGLWLLIDCKMHDLEWPWAAMSTNLQFSRCYRVRGGSRKKYLGGLAPHHLGGNNEQNYCPIVQY